MSHAWKNMMVKIAGLTGCKVPVSTGTLIRFLFSYSLYVLKGLIPLIPLQCMTFVMDLKTTEQNIFIQQDQKWNIDPGTSHNQRYLKEEAAVRFQPHSNKLKDMWVFTKLNHVFSREIVEEYLLRIHCDSGKVINVTSLPQYFDLSGWLILKYI